MPSLEIDSYSDRARKVNSLHMMAPEKLDPRTLIPELSSQVGGLRDNFGGVIGLKNTGKSDGLWYERTDGPYEMETWPALFKDALSRLDPALMGGEGLKQIIDRATANVIAALTLRSAEGIEKVEDSAGWSRFLKDTQRWAARWTEEGTRREYLLGSREGGVVGAYVEIAPREGFEQISRLALGELNVNAAGEFGLERGAMIDVRSQPIPTYLGRFVMGGEERTWQGRYSRRKD